MGAIDVTLAATARMRPPLRSNRANKPRGLEGLEKSMGGSTRSTTLSVNGRQISYTGSFPITIRGNKTDVTINPLTSYEVRSLEEAQERGLKIPENILADQDWVERLQGSFSIVRIPLRFSSIKPEQPIRVELNCMFLVDGAFEEARPGEEKARPETFYSEPIIVNHDGTFEFEIIVPRWHSLNKDSNIRYLSGALSEIGLRVTPENRKGTFPIQAFGNSSYHLNP